MLQAGEIVIILVLALVLLGPKRMPETARKIGRWLGEIRNAAQEISQGVQAEVAKATAPFDDVKRDLAETVGEVDPTRFKWTGPSSSEGPSPEDALSDLEEINKTAPDITEEPRDG
jgi:sec-independent protein translocase protein TatB